MVTHESPAWTVEDEVLQRYFDGDLPPEQIEAVRRAIETDLPTRARYDSLVRLQRLLVDASTQAVEQADFSGLYARIRQQINVADAMPPATHAGSADPVALPGPRLVTTRRANDEVTTPDRAADVGASGSAPKGAWSARRVQFWAPVAGSMAVAAAVLLMFYAPGDEAALPTDGAAVDRTAQVKRGSLLRAMRARLPSEVVSVDFGSSTGTVFEIESVEGGSTPVVWINDGE